MNQESSRLQKQLIKKQPSLLQRYQRLPVLPLWHIFKKIIEADEQTFQIAMLHPGEFSVTSTVSNLEAVSYAVSFGDSLQYPSCTCKEWQCSKLPCIHFATVFSQCHEWSYDMLSPLYISNPQLNLDYTVQVNKVPPSPGISKSKDASSQIEGKGQHKSTKVREQEENDFTLNYFKDYCQDVIDLLLKINLKKQTSSSLLDIRGKLANHIRSLLPLEEIHEIELGFSIQEIFNVTETVQLDGETSEILHSHCLNCLCLLKKVLVRPQKQDGMQELKVYLCELLEMTWPDYNHVSEQKTTNPHLSQDLIASVDKKNSTNSTPFSSNTDLLSLDFTSNKLCNRISIAPLCGQSTQIINIPYQLKDTQTNSVLFTPRVKDDMREPLNATDFNSDSRSSGLQECLIVNNSKTNGIQ